MKRLICAAALLLLCATGARAEQVQMTVDQARGALGALKQLSAGRTVLVKEGAAEKAVTVPYKGWPLATMLAMSKDLANLKAAVQPYEDSVRQLARSMSDSDGKIVGADQVKFVEEQERVLTQTVAVDIDKFSLADLKVEANDISNPALIADLAPLLKQ